MFFFLGILTHAVSQHGEYIQTGPALFEDCTNPNEPTANHDSLSSPLENVPYVLPVLPKAEQYSLVEQIPSKRLKAHCVSASLKGCKNLRFVHDPVSCSVVIEDADHQTYHTKMFIVKPMDMGSCSSSSSSSSTVSTKYDQPTTTQHIEGIFPMVVVFWDSVVLNSDVV